MKKAFTLIEMLVVVAVMGLLASLMVPAVNQALEASRIAASRSNLGQLAAANLAYTVDHRGFYAPAQDVSNQIRWHGGRASTASPFEPGLGFLSPYLGESGRVKHCPLLKKLVPKSTSWELGTGGYGYNATYIGGRPGDTYTPTTTSMVSNPSRTVMFTTSGFSKQDGVQEYPYTEPYQWLNSKGNPAGRLQPSTHFRAHGKALVAWADGHVSAEAPNDVTGPNYYQGDNRAAGGFGWFGPSDHNGYWNPAWSPSL